MHRQLTTVLLVFLLIVLTSAAPLIVREIQKPQSNQTASTSTTSRSDDSQTASFNVPLPTIHKQAQKLSLKLNDPLADLPFFFSVIPSTNRDLPTVHNKHNPTMISDFPIGFKKRDASDLPSSDKGGMPLIYSAKPSINSDLPYGLNQASSLPTVNDQIKKSSPRLKADSLVIFDASSSSNSDFPFIYSEQKPAESSLPFGYKKHDIHDI